jgi:hypothetical protein
MKEITIPLRRFSVKVGDLDPLEADWQMPLRDEATGELCGITWMICYQDHNEIGTAKDIPYMVIDRETPLSLQDFMSLAISQPKAPPPKGYS